MGQELRAARRVLRPKGLLFADAISRFASLVDNLAHLGRINLPPVLADPAVESMVRLDLAGGPHRNPTSEARYFTTAYFHHPDALVGEIRAAGLALVDLLQWRGSAPSRPGLGRCGRTGRAARRSCLSCAKSSASRRCSG